MKVAVKEAFDCLDEIRTLFLEYAADLECSLDFQDFRRVKKRLDLFSDFYQSCIYGMGGDGCRFWRRIHFLCDIC